MTSETSRRTVAHYNGRSEIFWEGTKDHDVEQNIQALLGAIDGDGPHRILEFGCGPGRDLKRFTELGHIAVGLDGAEKFVNMAKDHSECEVWLQDFLALDLPHESFDGIFANASLFHVPSEQLGRVLGELEQTLKSGGILFSSNPRGDDQSQWYGERYGCYHSIEGWRRYLQGAGLVELSHYYRPKGLPREEQGWLASVWRKP